MTAPNIQVGLVSNVFVRQMVFANTGDTEEGHSHPFDHVTLLAKGSLDVTVDGVTTNFSAPQMIFIAKDIEHTLVATVPDTVAYCIHGLRDTSKSDDIISPDMIPARADLEAFIRQNTGRV